jgi:hypothetical protein
MIHAGHGLSNSAPGIFDTGATSCYGSEHEIVSRIADEVVDRAWRNELAQFSTIPVPVCSQSCIPHHPRRKDTGGYAGHLAYLIEWINDNAIKGKRGYSDFVVSLHMNSGGPEASGVEVIYDNAATPLRREQARVAAEVLANTLGLQNRGAYADSKTPRRSIAIVEDTLPPALLFELGFVTNEIDVQRVRECGVEAVEKAIAAVRGVR